MAGKHPDLELLEQKRFGLEKSGITEEEDCRGLPDFHI